MLLRPASHSSPLSRLRAAAAAASIAPPPCHDAGSGSSVVARTGSSPRQVLPPIPRCWGVVARRGLHDDMARKNHYQRLNVRHDASPAEIKKSFYSLSKTHHPDASPNNPRASETFSLLSESYTILSDASRRAAYDRDVMRLHQQQQAHHGHANPNASYHSSNAPAGGRSPSGLSRRRGTFRGPPPSFYRSGGWGDHSEKRRKAHEESTGAGPDGRPNNTNSAGGGGGGGGDHPGASSAGGSSSNPWASAYENTNAWQYQKQHGGMGPGEDPFGHQGEAPHFDKVGHTRTHRREDNRRQGRSRRAINDDDTEFEPQTSVAGHFMIVSGILLATILAPLTYMQVMRMGRRRKEEAGQDKA